MNDGELRILEYVRGQIDGVREDIRDLRNELLTQFMRHDASDNERFGELFARVRPLEIGSAVQQHHAAETSVDEARWHNWQIALLTVLAILAASLIGALVTVHFTAGQP